MSFSVFGCLALSSLDFHLDYFLKCLCINVIIVSSISFGAEKRSSFELLSWSGWTHFVIRLGLEPRTPSLKGMCSTCWASESTLLALRFSLKCVAKVDTFSDMCKYLTNFFELFLRIFLSPLPYPLIIRLLHQNIFINFFQLFFCPTFLPVVTRHNIKHFLRIWRHFFCPINSIWEDLLK